MGIETLLEMLKSQMKMSPSALSTTRQTNQYFGPTSLDAKIVYDENKQICVLLFMFDDHEFSTPLLSWAVRKHTTPIGLSIYAIRDLVHNVREMLLCFLNESNGRVN